MTIVRSGPSGSGSRAPSRSRRRWPAGVGAPERAGPSQERAPAQKLDADYTAKIKAATADPRILTELVDHMPASDKVPSPLKFLGYIPGEPGKLTYHKDIVRYMEALDKASDRVTMMKIGESDEGRDMVAVVIADEATIKNLDKYRQITAQLTDPRKLTDAQAKQLIATGKPIYYAMGSIHSPEVGSPEMLMELAYRLAVEETPFIQTIRNNAIVVLTPASEVDGREKQVDNFRAQAAGQPSPSMVYWGKYVQHDNNRDGIGVGLRLTQVMLKTFLDWHPTVWHDLHESVTLLYTSTGTGPVQRGRRSDPGQRVVAARADRDHGDDQAQRARRVDLQLLRRLGPELHVLDRRHAQLDRPVLRDAELRRRGQPSAAGHPEPRVVPAESDAARHERGARATTSTCRRARCCWR